MLLCVCLMESSWHCHLSATYTDLITTMLMSVHRGCCAIFPVLAVFHLARVSGDHLLTIGVMLSKQTHPSPAVKRSVYALHSSTDPEVLVYWATVADKENPFRLAQQFGRLADLGADIVVLPEDTAPSLKSALIPSQGNTAPPIITYQTKPAASEHDLADECARDFIPSPSEWSMSVETDDECARDFITSPSAWSIDVETECDPKETGTLVGRADVLVSVIKELKWKELVILYEDSEEMVVKELSDSLSSINGETHFLLYTLNYIVHNHTGTSGSGQDRQLLELLDTLYFRRTDELRVVLLCSVTCLTRVLSAASRFDASHRKKTAMRMISRWLLILPPEVATVLEQCDLHLDNVAVILHPPSTHRAIGNITNEMPNVLTSAYGALVDFNASLTTESLLLAIKQILMQPDTCYGSPVKTLLWKPEGRRLSDVGYVFPNATLCCGSDVFPNIKFGLNNRTFLVATLPWPSFVERDVSGGYQGLCVDLLRHLQTALNFSYQWTEPADGEWGTLNADKKWTGLVGLLERQEVDLVVAPLAMQAEREKVMDFIHPFYLDYTTVLLKLPDPNESKWRRLVQPFKPQVHMCIWFSLLGVTFITAVMEAFNPFYVTHPRSILHVGDMFWYMYGALLTQGGARLPDSHAGRTMVSAFWLFSIVMAAIYSGNLIAFMTVTKEEAPFQTVRGMVSQDDYKWGTAGGTSWVNIFQSSTNEVFKKIWAGIESYRKSDPDVLASDPEVHLRKVKDGKYSYIGDKSAITTWLLSECDLIAIKEEFLPMQYSIGLVNNSAYTTMFSDEMLRINEIGLTETWTRKWWHKTSFCKGPLINEPQPIYLIDVQSAFYFVFIGITLAFITLGLERLCSRFQIGSKMRKYIRKKKLEQESSLRGASFRKVFGFGSRKKRTERVEIHGKWVRNRGVHFYGKRTRTMNPLFYDEGGGASGASGCGAGSLYTVHSSSSSLGQNGFHSSSSCDSNSAGVSGCDSVVESVFT